MNFDDTGITVPELIEIVPSFFEEVLEEYEDDHKLSAEEIVTALAHFCDKLQHAATGTAARVFGVAELALRLAARLV